MHTLSLAFALTVTNWVHNGHIDFNNIIAYDRVAAIAILSVPFSLPGVFGLLFLIWMATGFIYDRSEQFRFIAFGCVFITLGCYVLLEAVLSLDFHLHEYLPLTSASVLAVVTALSITRKYYYRYFKSTDYQFKQP